jgi:hypothetical protein
MNYAKYPLDKNLNYDDADHEDFVDDDYYPSKKRKNQYYTGYDDLDEY